MATSPTVRSRLINLVLVFMVPTLLASLATILYVYHQERRGFEQGLAEATRALSLVVDREITRREAVLQTLALSPALQTNDLKLFYAYARELAPTDDATIVLADVNGQQLLNTLRPLGEKLPRTVFIELRRQADARATLVSNVYMAPMSEHYSFAVEVPVVRNGQVAYYLAMGSFVEHMQQVLKDQRLPAGWVGTIIDRRGAVVARTEQPERHVGQTPPAELMQQAETSGGGAFRVGSLDRTPMLATFNRSPRHGWGVFIGVPESQITAPWRAASLFSFVAAMLLVMSLFAARRMSRSIVTPIARMADDAARLGRGEAVAPRTTGLAETDRVAQALSEASDAVRGARLQLQQRVDEAVDEAEKAHKAMIRNQRLEAVGQLTGGVAHDFNNLLMVVGTNVHLLRQRHPALADEQALQRVERAVSTGTKLTRQLLAFARRQPIRPQVIAPVKVVPDLMELIRPTLGGGVQLSCDVGASTGSIEVDPAEFELALINLAVNARDAMPDGGMLAVRVRDMPDAAGEPRVAVEMQDSGTGIDPAILDKVFEPFFTTKEVGRGTGLGLSQVYGMVTEAGGTVQVDSQPGHGTTVRLLLPRVQANTGSVDATRPGGAALRLACVVLLVEDNPELAQATSEVLLQAGCTVHLARSGDEAAQVLPTLRPAVEVVLSDVRMPGELDGIDLARHIREKHPGIPVVLMTGYTAELQAARGLRLEVLAKPVQPAQLLQALAGANAQRVAAA